MSDLKVDWFRKTKIPAKETPLNLILMRLIDEQYLKTTFYGYPKMTEYLRKQGYLVNPKRITIEFSEKS